MKYKRLGFLIAFAFLLSASSALAATETLTGLIQQHYVDFPDGSARLEHTIVSGSDITKLDLSNLEKAVRDRFQLGAVLAISGEFKTDGDFLVSGIQSEMLAASSPGLAELSGSFKVGIILVNLSDATVPCSASQIENIMYNNPENVKEHLEESSRGEASLNSNGDGVGGADIFGPYTIAHSRTSCTYSAWATAADSAAAADGFNASNYDSVMYILPHYSQLACGWAGLASVGCIGSSYYTCRSWIALCTSETVIAHELGHNYGFGHASTDPDNDGNINVEYGDYSCPMGNSSRFNMFNAPHQDQLGWFDSYAGAVNNTTSLGTFTLSSLEVSPSTTSNPQVVRFPHASGDYYYFSYREDGVGTYSDLSSTFNDKLSIHRYAGSGYNNTRLIDTLDVGEIFYDLTTGISVEHDSNGSSELTFTIDSVGLSPDDTDNDGVSDIQEGIDGTSSTDPGSFQMRLASPVHTLWNGFLGMYNYLELVNPGGSGSVTVTVEVFALDGTLGSTSSYTLAAGEQQDVFLNILGGFSPDSYGVVRLTYSGTIDGRVSYYRLVSNGTYEFAYSVPLSNANMGESSVGFNTYQPSLNGFETTYAVYNWLSLVNLASTTKTYTVYSYDQLGNLITTRAISLDSFQRTDIDGGHGLVGPSRVGSHRIVPDDTSAPYIGQLIRYGSNAPMSMAASGYFFAFPLSARAGNGQTQYVPLSRAFGEENWLEILNTSGSAITVGVQFRDGSGNQVYNTSVALDAYAQVNLSPQSYLSNGDVGQAIITPSASNSVIAQSMYYFRDTYTSQMTGMYGTTGRESLGSSLSGSYNLYLGMENYLRVINTSSSYSVVTVAVTSPSGTVSRSYGFGANVSYDFSLHDFATFGAAANTYGYVTVTTDNPGSIISELLRYRPLGADEDFIFPTEVRP